MPSFKYIGDPERVYANIPGTPAWGVAYELDSDPGDGRWERMPDPEPTTEQAQEASATAGASSVSEAVEPSADSAEEA